MPVIIKLVILNLVEVTFIQDQGAQKAKTSVLISLQCFQLIQQKFSLLLEQLFLEACFFFQNLGCVFTDKTEFCRVLQ